MSASSNMTEQKKYRENDRSMKDIEDVDRKGMIDYTYLSARFLIVIVNFRFLHQAHYNRCFITAFL